jgi:hypothetical protein
MTRSTKQGEHVGLTFDHRRARLRRTTPTLARAQAAVLVSSDPRFPSTIPVVLMDRRDSRGVITLNFGHRSYEATTIAPVCNAIRLDHTEVFQGKTLFHVWVEIAPDVFNRLIHQAKLLPDEVLGFAFDETLMPTATPFHA